MSTNYSFARATAKKAAKKTVGKTQEKRHNRKADKDNIERIVPKEAGPGSDAALNGVLINKRPPTVADKGIKFKISLKGVCDFHLKKNAHQLEWILYKGNQRTKLLKIFMGNAQKFTLKTLDMRVHTHFPFSNPENQTKSKFFISFLPFLHTLFTLPAFSLFFFYWKFAIRQSPFAISPLLLWQQFSVCINKFGMKSCVTLAAGCMRAAVFHLSPDRWVHHCI